MTISDLSLIVSIEYLFGLGALWNRAQRAPSPIFSDGELYFFRLGAFFRQGAFLMFSGSKDYFLRMEELRALALLKALGPGP